MAGPTNRQTDRATACQMDGWMIGRMPTKQREDAKDDSMNMIVEKPQMYYRCVMYEQTDGLTDLRSKQRTDGTLYREAMT